MIAATFSHAAAWLHDAMNKEDVGPPIFIEPDPDLSFSKRPERSPQHAPGMGLELDEASATWTGARPASSSRSSRKALVDRRATSHRQ
jgi:hypothetical protein